MHSFVLIVNLFFRNYIKLIHFLNMRIFLKVLSKPKLVFKFHKQFLLEHNNINIFRKPKKITWKSIISIMLYRN